MNRYFIVKFNDLKEEKQEEIKKEVAKSILENEVLWSDVVGGDLTKNPQTNIEEADTKADLNCSKAWFEMEVEI